MKSIYTKRLIANSLKNLMLKKPLDSITVDDIVKECDLSRNVFYYHFANKSDLIIWHFDETMFGNNKSMEINNADLTCRDLFYRIADEIAKERCYYTKVLHLPITQGLAAHVQDIFYTLALYYTEKTGGALKYREDVCSYFSRLMTCALCIFASQSEKNATVRDFYGEIFADVPLDAYVPYLPILFLPDTITKATDRPAFDDKNDRTKEKLAYTLSDLLQKTDMDKITTSSIVEACGISRHTFYYHFMDKHHLLLWLYEREIGLKIRDWENHDDYCCLLQIIMNYIGAHKNVYGNSLTNLGQNSLGQYVYESTYKILVTKNLQPGAARGFNIQQKRISQCRAMAATYNIIDWAQNGMQEYRDSDYKFRREMSMGYLTRISAKS